MVAILVSGCGGAPGPASPATIARSATPTGSSRATNTAASVPPAERLPLPSGFPGLPDAVAMPMPEDDPGLIGLWSSDRAGSAAYDFYVSTLPAAGYPIVGLYPGGAVALIRFSAPGGAVWQMVAYGGAPGTVTIEVRVDRP